MQKRLFQKMWFQIRCSPWYPAIVAVLPSLIISLAWSFGRSTNDIVGAVVSFVAIEGLVILILIIARPSLQAEQLLGRINFIEIDTQDSKILIGRIKAEFPPPELIDDWSGNYLAFRKAWADLLRESEYTLSADSISAQTLQGMTNTLTLASAQIRAGSAFDLYTMKRAACYLEQLEAQKVTQIMIVNRIQLALWFTPEMIIYHLDLYRHCVKHPLDPQVIRISILDKNELRLASSPQWRVSLDIDPLKAFVALNQMAGIKVKGLTQEKFSAVVESFIVDNETKIQTIDGTDPNELKEFIRDVAFLMYCEEGQPIKVFRGRPTSIHEIPSRHARPVIKFPEISNEMERKLYWDLFTMLDEAATSIPQLNLARAYL